MEEIFEKNKCFEIKTICLKEERKKSQIVSEEVTEKNTITCTKH